MATQHELRAIAVRACCDPRTVLKYLSGGRVEANVAERIRRAIAELKSGDAA